ncbi:hypothetical protein L484_019016 [Morus notabilis]|uniref:Uncharacterized protein n=1 Tax=Morus notabilis TaxID=981085 RepID=W9QUG9_9ROSA|nr:hypothetical protein L484_019016 [Morus notabilis]
MPDRGRESGRHIGAFLAAMIPADDGRCNEIGKLRQREEEAQHHTASRTSRDRTSHVDPLTALSREPATDRRWTVMPDLQQTDDVSLLLSDLPKYIKENHALEGSSSEASSTYDDHKKMQMEFTENSQPGPFKRSEPSSQFLLDLKHSNEKSAGGSKLELNLFNSINPSSPHHACNRSVKSSGKLSCEKKTIETKIFHATFVRDRSQLTKHWEAIKMHTNKSVEWPNDALRNRLGILNSLTTLIHTFLPIICMDHLSISHHWVYG